MRLVILESPFAANDSFSQEEHEIYARACVRDSLGRGESPIASHLLYTQPGILDDTIKEERQWGIDAGLAWRNIPGVVSVVYTDYGISKGMQYGIDAANKTGNVIEYRKIK